MLPLRPFCDSSFLREEEAAKNEKRRGKTSPYFAGEEERTREKETRASLIEVKTQGILRKLEGGWIVSLSETRSTADVTRRCIRNVG
jgi:hypothetical protein